MLDLAAIAAAQANKDENDEDEGGDGGSSLYRQFKITRKLKPPNYPIRNQVLQRLGSKTLRVGVASCQGKRCIREDMEDAHIAQLSLPKHPGAGLFGVFDGHNGPDAARWVAANLASFVDDVKAFGEAELKTCLIHTDRAFLKAQGINDNHGSTAVFAILQNLDVTSTIDAIEDKGSPTKRRKGKDDKKKGKRGASPDEEGKVDDSDKGKAGFESPQEDGKSESSSQPKGKGKGNEKEEDNTETNHSTTTTATTTTPNTKEVSVPVATSGDESDRNAMTGKWFATVCNLGDSRCVIGHYSKPDAIPLTVDHKPTDEAEVKRIQEAGGHVTRRRVDGVLAVSRAIGDSTYKADASLPPEKQKVIPVPVVTTHDISEDNFMFICCDGIFESFTTEEAVRFIHEKRKKTDDLAFILSELLTAVTDKGSQDNMTAMLIEFRDGSDYNKPDELVIGEWYDRGNPGYEIAWKNHCAYLGKDPEELKQMWFDKKKLLDDPVLVTEKLKELRETFGTLEMGTEVLRMALCSGDSGKAKKRFGKTIS